MRRAQGSAGAASSRAPSAGITASDSDPSVRRRPPPLGLCKLISENRTSIYGQMDISSANRETRLLC